MIHRINSSDTTTARQERAPSRLSQLKEFGRMNTTPRLNGGGDANVIAKSAGLHSIQARVGSVTKRLSAFNVGVGRRDKDKEKTDLTEVGNRTIPFGRVDED